MKKEKLMDAIGEIDEKLIDSADGARSGKKTKKIRWRKILIAAACVALAAAMVVTLALNFGGGSKRGVDVKDNPGTEAPLDGEFSIKTREGSRTGELVKEGEYGGFFAVEDEDSDGMAAVRGDGDYVKGTAAPGGVEGDPPFPSIADPIGEGEGEGEGDGEGIPVEIADPNDSAAPFILTASEWRDNDNWPFFTNLVNSGIITFPSYGVDPRNRIRVTVTDGEGDPVEGEAVVLTDADGKALWTARSDKDGAAYLFWKDGETPAAAVVGETKTDVRVAGKPGEQGEDLSKTAEDVTVTVDGSSREMTALQVMFILDTTGSMGDELAYLQMDFSSIAGDVGADGVYYSVNFYRDEGDEYVTKCSTFTSDVDAIKGALMDETCDGGGDLPEAVAQVLTDTITDNENWRDDCRKIAFLIFDAPPHDGVDEEIDAAVRSAAARGIKLIPVVASGTDRDTELFGRALAITTGGTYVFITDDSGVGNSHLEPIIGDHEVVLLHDLIVKIINENKVG
ncbi:MAG: VWA domain-containing protein [Clostridia bacterium]|nr:VWA domain-containing protein [Clostridia bacterium]